MNHTVIDKFLAEQDLPSVLALGTSATETLYEGTAGTSIDTPHAIMSMTKPITSFAIMQLVESGAVSLDAPIAEYVPQYAGLCLIGTTKPPDTPVTVQHLLTHTAGLGYSFCNETLMALRPDSDRTDFGLLHEPGEQWTYSVATKVLGEIVSAVTGKELGSALRDSIFDPLEMGESGFELKDDQVHPHVNVNGEWQRQDRFSYMPFGDGGLVSTIRDYAKFLRCLLNEGGDILGRDLFKSMISNQIGDLTIQTQPAANKAFTHPFPRGGGIDKFGLGFQIHLETQPGMRSPGSYSWCGLLNTYFWGDPEKKVGGIVFMQVLPLFEPACLDALDGFERRFYEQLN